MEVRGEGVEGPLPSPPTNAQSADSFVRRPLLNPADMAVRAPAGGGFMASIRVHSLKAFAPLNRPGWMRSRCERMASQREAIHLELLVTVAHRR